MSAAYPELTLAAVQAVLRYAAAALQHEVV